MTLLDLAYSDLSCLITCPHRPSYFHKMQTLLPRYLTVFTYVNGSVPIETVGQDNLKRQG